MDLTFSAEERAFENEVTSNSGSGNTIELAQNIFNLQLSYKH